MVARGRAGVGQGVRLHLGCGSVWLEGYLNIDVKAPNTFLAAERPDLVEKWRTTDDAYYAKHKDKTQDVLRAGPLDQEYVCDMYGSFQELPQLRGDVQEVLARHSFEHLSITEARQALRNLRELMSVGGILRLDVPDHEASLELLIKTQDRFYVRHLLGPRRNDYGFHMMSFTKERLRTLVEEYGFGHIGEEKNIHFYPAFCLRFSKV